MKRRASGPGAMIENVLRVIRRRTASIAVVALIGFAVALVAAEAIETAPARPDFKTISTPSSPGERFPSAVWSRADDPAQFGWSRAGLQQARARADALGSSAVVIVDDGVVIDAWGDLKKRYQCRSMRKSFLSMLYGAAVERGQIDLSASLEALGIDDEPPLTEDERRATVFDLLTARSGVYHAANFESAGMRKKRPPRGAHPPGDYWYYNNWDFNALGGIYERETGERVFDAFRREIAEPIGMERHLPEDGRYFHGDYSVFPAYRFRLSPLDLARLGLLMARDGVWRGERVLPAGWTERMTRAYVDTGRKGFHAGYGMMWWVGDDGYAAVGARGQRLFVLPDDDIVIVHFVDADVKGLRAKTSDIRSLVELILAARDDETAPAPVNMDAAARAPLNAPAPQQ